jgi:hypothetical protein
MRAEEIINQAYKRLGDMAMPMTAVDYAAVSGGAPLIARDQCGYCGRMPERCYLSIDNRSISFWPDVTGPVEIVVKGFRDA